MQNGDRSYKMEVKPGENIGSYHVLEGQKVSLRYSGQQQTYGRCHGTPQKCLGKGFARKCEAAGGVKIEFTDYILALWKRIGYFPSKDDLANINSEENEVEVEQIVIGGTFTPVKVPSGPVEKYNGVRIKQFPRETDQGQIMEFLCLNGLPDVKKDNVIIRENGSVTIRDLDNDTCRNLIEAIHGKTHLDRKLYCNGIIPLTPEKIEPSNAASGPSTAASGPPADSSATSPTPSSGGPTLHYVNLSGLPGAPLL